MSSKTPVELDEDLDRQGRLPAYHVAQPAAAAAAADGAVAEGAGAAVAAAPGVQGAATAGAAAAAAAADVAVAIPQQEETPWCCCSIAAEFRQEYTFVSREGWARGCQNLLESKRFLPVNPDRIPLKYVSIAAGARGETQDY